MKKFRKKKLIMKKWKILAVPMKHYNQEFKKESKQQIKKFKVFNHLLKLFNFKKNKKV